MSRSEDPNARLHKATREKIQELYAAHCDAMLKHAEWLQATCLHNMEGSGHGRASPNPAAAEASRRWESADQREREALGALFGGRSPELLNVLLAAGRICRDEFLAQEAVCEAAAEWVRAARERPVAFLDRLTRLKKGNAVAFLWTQVRNAARRLAHGPIGIAQGPDGVVDDAVAPDERGEHESLDPEDLIERIDRAMMIALEAGGDKEGERVRRDCAFYMDYVWGKPYGIVLQSIADAYVVSVPTVSRGIARFKAMLEEDEPNCGGSQASDPVGPQVRPEERFSE